MGEDVRARTGSQMYASNGLRAAEPFGRHPSTRGPGPRVAGIVVRLQTRGSLSVEYFKYCRCHASISRERGPGTTTMLRRARGLENSSAKH